MIVSEGLDEEWRIRFGGGLETVPGLSRQMQAATPDLRPVSLGLNRNQRRTGIEIKI